MLRCYSKSIRVAQYISSVCMTSTCTTGHISVHTQPMKHPHGRYDSKYRLSYYITHNHTHHSITVLSVCSHTDKLVLVLRALNAIDDPLCMHVQYICILYRVALAYTYSVLCILFIRNSGEGTPEEYCKEELLITSVYVSVYVARCWGLTV